jgi:predicted transcriptional regulator
MHLPDSRTHNPDPAYLRSLIEQAGLSQRKVAIYLGISDRSMRKYFSLEHGGDCPYTVQYCLEVLAMNPKIKTNAHQNNSNE